MLRVEIDFGLMENPLSQKWKYNEKKNEENFPEEKKKKMENENVLKMTKWDKI